MRARVIGSRLRVGAFARPGDALTLIQGDATTCGATAVLAARLLLGDAPPALAARARGPRPVRALERALAAEGRRLQAHMNRRAGGPLGPLPWTRRLGSTPWAVAAAMSAPAGGGPRYAVRRVDDAGPAWPGDVEALRARLADGAPVILLTGGPLARPRPDDGILAGALHRVLAAGPALPRHYVLAVPAMPAGPPEPGAGRVRVYDPSSGAVGVLDLLAPRGRHGPGPRELGYWPRILSLIEPRAEHPRGAAQTEGDL
ncbi:hypothetical protein AM609_02890 [Actinomyces sp. oral taxon 414]|nr:hypothetical protein AM609_02890 [Actinomyces sp. oral taxon 414]